MNNLITIYCKNNKQYYQVPAGTSLQDLLEKTGIELPFKTIAAHVNYKTQSLNYILYKPKDVEFIDASNPSGYRVYIRTLCMILSKAVKETLPHSLLIIDHPINRGYFCRIDGHELSSHIIEAIKNRMQEIVAQEISIVRREEQTPRVIDLFRSQQRTDLVNLLESLNKSYTQFYEIDGYVDYFVGAMAPTTAYTPYFDLVPYKNGMLLKMVSMRKPTEIQQDIEQPKLFEIFSNYKKWNKHLGVSTVGEFNKISGDDISSLIKISEALQERRISKIADSISSKEGCRFVLIAGPSSSGKTSFAKRLSVQLAVIGLKPVMISLDDYFVNREDTPLDENGDWDFESLHAIDLPLFKDQMNRLLAGQEVEIPFFNFKTGKREWVGKKLQLNENNILIMEGIHALNPELTEGIDSNSIYKIYVSALTTIALDNHNWVSTTDTRLIRRIVRDYNFRGYSAADTISRWPSVRRGEEKWIFPYQENADVMFNSALLFELAVMRQHAEPILNEVPENTPEYIEAVRLRKFISYFKPVYDKELPPTSLLREFLGGSSFKY